MNSPPRMSDEALKYAPIALVVISLLFQWNLFVTPEKLEIKHREILKDVAITYVTKDQHNDVKTQLTAMQAKIDKMYDVITNNRR